MSARAAHELSFNATLGVTNLVEIHLAVMISTISLVRIYFDAFTAFGKHVR